MTTPTPWCLTTRLTTRCITRSAPAPPARTQAGIALARADLAATALTPLDGAVLTDGLQYALAPQLVGLKSLFDAGRLAIQLNVGPLIQPTTLAQYQSSNRAANPLPPKLFSHNDQQSVWQSDGSEGSTNGWGGRLGDIALSSNPSNSQLTCISASSNAVFVAGRDAIQYQISGSGAIRINALGGPLRNAVNAIVTRSSAHVLENECAAVTRRSIELEGTVNAALGGVTLTTAFPDGQSAREADARGGAVDRCKCDARRETPGVLRVARWLRQSQLAHARITRDS